jgi:PAS domain S-box-containing protein
MFRPSPEQTLFGQIPVRLILSIILIFAVALTLILILGIEREKNVVEGLVKVQELSQQELLTFLQSRKDLIFVTIILFLVSGIGISVVVTTQSYHATRKTLEQVKSLARSILYSLPTGVLTIDRRGSVTAVNPFAEKILKVPAGEILGKPFMAIFPEQDPIRDILQSAFERGNHVKDQDIAYPVGCSESPATVRLSTSELKDIDQASAGVVMLLQDISELIRLEQQLRRSDKLSALHTLSAGVAHEIRNPLSALDLNLHLLDQEIRGRNSSKEVEHYLRVLDAEIERLKGILDNFTRFTKPSAIRLQEVRLCEVLGQLSHLLEFEAKEKGIRLISRFPENPIQIMGDGTQLSQAFLNILINAIQAIPREGTVTVEVRMAGGDISFAEILIHDTGAGIPASEIPRLFEPFYTTKKEGSGLGLPIAHRIIEDHHGTIQVHSTVGVGTTVLIRLPLQAAGERSPKVTV